MMSAVEIIPANDRYEDVLSLMKEYVAWLMMNDDKMKEVLANQHLDDEVADFNSKYAPPDGRLYLALLDNEPVGCIALTNLSDQLSDNDPLATAQADDNDPNHFVCEGKRLFVRPQARGHQIGRLLMDRIIDDAREIGYRYMRLDSFPFMASAVKMYDHYGFYPIGNYCNNPSENAIFRELDLSRHL